VTGTLFDGSVVDVAQRLLGRTLHTAFDGVVTRVLITEVEAYGGAHDPASHAFRGETPRNGSMFGPPGTLYVYRSYGVHWCANVVTGPTGEPSAVLIRGGEAIAGIDTMARRRGRSDHLCDGPGKLCQALGVTGVDDGTSLVDGPVRLLDGEPRVHFRIEESPRIGISAARDRPWRFVARTPDGSTLTAT